MASRLPPDLATPPHDAARRARPDGTPTPWVTRTVVVNGATVRVIGPTRPPGVPHTTPDRPRAAAASTVAPPARSEQPAPAPHAPERELPDLPPEVRRLLWYHVDTVEKIEILEYACGATQPWTTAQLGARLGLDERAIAVATVGLCQADLLRRHGDSYQRTPRASLVGAALEVLRRAHGFAPPQVLLAIRQLAHGRSTT